MHWVRQTLNKNVSSCDVKSKQCDQTLKLTAVVNAMAQLQLYKLLQEELLFCAVLKASMLMSNLNLTLSFRD